MTVSQSTTRIIGLHKACHDSSSRVSACALTMLLCVDWRRLILGLVLLVVSGIFMPAEAQFSNGYSYRREVNIVDAEVIGGPHTNVPVLIDSTLLDLRTTANGGKVENANGYDIIFTSDLAGTTQLAHEIERYVATTGEIVFWVRIESLVATTKIYMFYGNSSIATFQGDVTSNGVTGVWDNDYKGVWHLHDDFLDSTSNNNDGTNFGSTDATGQVADGQDFDASDDRIDVAHSASNNISGDFTISMWMNPDALTSADMLISKGGTGSGGTDVIWMKAETGGATRNRLRIRDASSNNISITSTLDYNVNDWNFVVGTFDNTNLTLYHDGQLDASTSATTGLDTNTLVWRIGRGNATSEAFDGTIDEVRISSVDRGPSWIETEYNNQFSPPTFYVLGAESTSPRALIKRAFETDGTPIPTGSTIPNFLEFKYLLYINNTDVATNDVSIQDVLDAAFQYQTGTIQVDNSVGECALAACTAAEELTIFTAVDGAAFLSDVVDGDVVSITGSTIDAGNQNAANAQLDIAADKVWAILLSAKMP